MRNLTIKRTKSFVGCLGKIEIYTEDPASGELTVNGTPCRKLGELKSGEEKTFQIEERELKVFAIAGKLSKEYCNDFYQLSAGEEDVFLSGKNHFNLANGNAFLFDDNENEAVLKNRKRGVRKGLIVLLVAVIAGTIAGCLVSSIFPSNNTQKEKMFSSNGINIILTDEFKEIESENYTVVYDSGEVAVFALKEPFSLVDGFENYTLDQYADLVLQSNDLSSSSKNNVDGLICFEYDFTDPETDNSYHYLSYVYKSNDAFWLLQFATLNKNAEKYSRKFEAWAKSVTFSN